LFNLRPTLVGEDLLPPEPAFHHDLGATVLTPEVLELWLQRKNILKRANRENNVKNPLLGEGQDFRDDQAAASDPSLHPPFLDSVPDIRRGVEPSTLFQGFGYSFPQFIRAWTSHRSPPSLGFLRQKPLLHKWCRWVIA
jgi:hypothetical protein